jgi:hypothetical protein
MKTKLLKILKKKNTFMSTIEKFRYADSVDDINNIFIMRRYCILDDVEYIRKNGYLKWWFKNVFND